MGRNHIIDSPLIKIKPLNDSTMTNNYIELIQKYSLTVRCLPYEVIRNWRCGEGREPNWKNTETKTYETIIQDFDLEHFQNTKPSKWETRTPQERFDNWKKTHPNGLKLIRETYIPEKGGWWYVKETPNTSSTVTFNREYDQFFAPTFEEAMELFLRSKTAAK